MSAIKKFFFLSLVILVLSLLFWGVYNLSFKKNESKTTDNDAKKEDPVSTPADKKIAPKILPISDEAVFSPVITEKENTIKYYSKNTGQVFEIDFDGKNKKSLSTTELPGLSGVAWSPDQTKVITRFDRLEETSFFFYDYAQNKGVALKKNLDETVWQNSGNKIFYKYYDPKTKERTLNISDPDGTNWQKLTDLSHKNIAIVQVPKTGLVSFWNRPDAFSETLFETIPTIGGEKKTIFQGKFGADYLWNSSGNNVLVSHSDQKEGQKIQLAVMNYNGGEFRNLLAPTMVSKCAWSKNNKFVYCAVPGNIPDNAIMPKDYLENKFTTIDTFWRINTETAEQARILEKDQLTDQVDATNLFLNEDESSLFFINRKDGKLYRLDM